jgi:hypothetical protein
MTTPSITYVDKSVTLETLNTLAQQQEQVVGPLTLIGNDGGKTLLSFDLDRDPPSILVKITPSDSGAPQGTAIVSTGVCFIGGNLTNVVAYRPG